MILMNIKSIVPILEWLPNYKKDWLKGDIGAGLTVGVMLIPQGIAYAMIAGLPPIYGLYTAMIPQVVYAIFGTSRQLAVGPVAMDSLIVASGVATLAQIGTDKFIEFAILLALFMGVLQVLFGIFKLGFLVNFLSKPVISGFTSAAALIIGLNQLKHLLGINISRSNRVQDLIKDAFNHLNEVSLITFAIGGGSIIILLLFKRYIRKVPAALVVLVVGIIAVKLFHLEERGVAIIGSIPEGLPKFHLPSFDKKTLTDLSPIALTLSFIAFLEAISVAKAIESKHSSYKVLPNQELFALGMGNIIGSFFQTYPATGGFSRTVVNDQTGANTPLSAIISALVVALTLLFLTPVFYNLPKAVLAAIIMVAVFGLLDFKVPKKLLKSSVQDLIILNITLLVTAIIGIKEGILTGVILSLAMIIYRSTKPHVAVLANIHGTHFYRNVNRFGRNVILKDDILIVRFDAQLYFANTTFFKDKLEELVINKGEKLKLIVIDGESMNSIDSTGIDTLIEIIEKYKSKGIEIVFSGMKGPVRDALERGGVMNIIKYEQCYMSIQEAIDGYESKSKNIESQQKFKKFLKQTNK
jgi:SulP family sulfate permease